MPDFEVEIERVSGSSETFCIQNAKDEADASEQGLQAACNHIFHAGQWSDYRILGIKKRVPEMEKEHG